MSDNEKVPTELQYTREHEWLRRGPTITVGITHYAQDQLGDITYVELPEVGDEVTAGGTFGVVESVKTYSDLYAPVSGTVTEVNDAAVDDPSLLNSAPYGDGWLVKIEPTGGESELMQPEEYESFVSEVND